jgi:cellulose biosynthesis protein BcsQ
MAKIVSFASPKGGSGKTVVSASLARLLSGLGKKVLMIDADRATNGLTLLYLDELVKNKDRSDENRTDIPRGLFDYEASTPDRKRSVVTHFTVDGVDVVPATYSMKPTSDTPIDVFESTLSAVLRISRVEYDYIFIDSQAGTDEFARIAMRQADETIIVSEFDPISTEGVDRLRRLFPEELSYVHTWILFNKILPEFASSIGDLLRVARYLDPIPWDADVVRAFSHRKLAIDMEKGNAFTFAIMRTLESLLGDEITQELTNWRKDKQEAIREPARMQLASLEMEIKDTEKALVDASFRTRYARRRIRVFQEFIVTAVVVAVILFLSLSTLSGVAIPINGTAVLMTAAIVIALTFLANFFLQERTRSEEEYWEETRLSLERRLSDLEESRQKYKALVDSELELRRR